MSALLTAPSTTFSARDIRTATEPPEYRGLTRDGVRLLVTDGAGITHTGFTDLPAHLLSGDVLVVNDSATLPAEVDGRRSSGRPVIVHLATDLGDGRWVAELRSAPDAAAPELDGEPGETVHLPGRARLRLLGPYPGPGPTGSGNRLWRVRVLGIRAVVPYLHRYGRPIAYGYLGRRFPLADYQTIFGVRPGSAEMPSAGRPFTTDLVSRLEAGGVAVVPVTLHTGVSSQDAGEAPQAECFEVPEPTAARVRA
ncbi:MAG TPA: S-adenosylmethionine:tRNA ribosyltransferase-isomerase, partial [Nakamurella sp.]